MTLLPTIPVILYLIVVLTTDVVRASTVYKWVDSQGHTHYSEDPPLIFPVECESVKSPAVTIEFTAPPDSRADRHSDYYSVVNQANRMQASRLARERLRLERHQVEEKARLRQWSSMQNVYKNLEHSAIIYPPYYGLPLYHRPPPVTYPPYRPPFYVFPPRRRTSQHNKFSDKVFKIHKSRDQKHCRLR